MKRIPFRLKRVLQLSLDGRRADSPDAVGYRAVDAAVLGTRKGIYAVVENGVLVYCGKYENGFDKRWLYVSRGTLYHFKKDRVAESLRQGNVVEVWAEEEEAIKAQLGLAGNEWVNCSGLESRLIARLQPAWNSLGRQADAHD